MNGFFQKLQININWDGVNLVAGNLLEHKKYTAWQKYGLAFKKKQNFTPTTNTSFNIDDDDIKKILAQLPSNLLAIEVPKVWLFHAGPIVSESRVMLPPHVDGIRRCSINIYFDAHGEKTAFYEYSAGGQINEVCSFVAKSNDVYLMNSDAPHSVEMVSGLARESISISFIKTPYEIVEKILKPYF